MSAADQLARLEAELEALEAGHDFTNGPSARIEELTAEIADLSIKADATFEAVNEGVAGDRQSASETRARSERRRTQRAAERRRRAARTRTVRRCKCGCGKKIPAEADPRRKFFNDEHRVAHNNGKGSLPTAPDTLRIWASEKPHEQAGSEGSKKQFCNTRENDSSTGAAVCRCGANAWDTNIDGDRYCALCGRWHRLAVSA